MNISEEVSGYAEELGLELMSTGGGYDYVCRFFGLDNSDEKVEVTLTNRRDGKSPDTLDEHCFVTIHMGNAGSPVPWLQFGFKDAREAMVWMKEMRLVAGMPRTS